MKRSSGGPVRHQDVGELRFRYPQVFGLAAGHLAVQLRVAEQCGTAAFASHLSRLTLRVKRAFTHPAMSTGDLERHHDSIAGTNLADIPTNLQHDSHRLVSQYVARAHEGAHGFVQVKI